MGQKNRTSSEIPYKNALSKMQCSSVAPLPPPFGGGLGDAFGRWVINLGGLGTFLVFPDLLGS